MSKEGSKGHHKHNIAPPQAPTPLEDVDFRGHFKLYEQGTCYIACHQPQHTTNHHAYLAIVFCKYVCVCYSSGTNGELDQGEGNVVHEKIL